MQKIYTSFVTLSILMFILIFSQVVALASSTASIKCYVTFEAQDTSAPTTTLTANPASPDGESGWFKTVPSITLTADEPAITYYSWISSAGPWTTYAASFNAPSGQNTLYYYSLDSASNVETIKNQLFRIDISAPTSSISSPIEGALLSGGSYTITGSASDSSSGMAKVEISINGGSWQLATGSSSWSLNWNLPSNGAYNIKSRATDNAGNIESPSPGINVTVVQDTTAPVTVLETDPASPGPGDWFRTIPLITLTANEPAITYYSWISSSGPWTTYSAPFSALIGRNTLYYYSIDTASNTEAVKNQPFRVKKR